MNIGRGVQNMMFRLQLPGTDLQRSEQYLCVSGLGKVLYSQQLSEEFDSRVTALCEFYKIQSVESDGTLFVRVATGEQWMLWPVLED